MKEKKAWETLFAPTPPSGVDFDEAASVVEGKGQVDMSITLDPSMQRCVDEFQMDPAGFLVANRSDSRISQWTRLAIALGESVTGDSTVVAVQPIALPTVATPLLGQPLVSVAGTASTVVSTAAGSASNRTLSASALLNASVGGGTPTAPVFGSGRAGGTSTGDDPREQRQRRPPPSSVSRVVPPRVIAILGTDVFSCHRDRILGVFQSIREGDSGAQEDLVQLERELRAIVRSMPTGYLIMASAELALNMIDSLRAGKDQSESDWFQANYVTGSYS